MRALLGIIVIGLILVLVGWITVDTSNNRPSATIETDKIERDVEKISDSVQDLGNQVDDAVEEEPIDRN